MGSVFGGLRQQTLKQLRVQPVHDLVSFDLRSVQKVLTGMRLVMRNMPSVGNTFIQKDAHKSPVKKFGKGKAKNKRGAKNARNKVAASAQVQQGLVCLWFHELLRVGVDTCLRPATRHFMLHEIWAQIRTHVDSTVVSSLLRSLYGTQSTISTSKHTRSKPKQTKAGAPIDGVQIPQDLQDHGKTLVALQPDDSNKTMQVLLAGPINTLVPDSQASGGSAGNEHDDVDNTTEITRVQAKSSDDKLAQEALSRALMDLYHRVWMGDRKFDVGVYVQLHCDTLTNPELVPPITEQNPLGNQSPSNSIAGSTTPSTQAHSFCISGFISDLVQVVDAYNHDQLVTARVKEQEFRKYERMQRMQRRALLDATKITEGSDREGDGFAARTSSSASMGSPPGSNVGKIASGQLSPNAGRMDSDLSKPFENVNAKGLVDNLIRPGRRSSGVIIRTVNDLASNVAEGTFTYA